MPKVCTGIDVSQVSQVDKRNICSTFFAAVQKFYDDPRNVQRFECWRKTKDAHSPTTQNS